MLLRKLLSNSEYIFPINKQRLVESFQQAVVALTPRRGIVLLATGFSPWLEIRAPPHPVVGAACIIKCIDRVGSAHYGTHSSIRSPSTG